MDTITDRALAGLIIIVTRPAGTGSNLVRRVRALGGQAFCLPGSALRAAADPQRAAAALQRAAQSAAVVFSSPAAVRFAFVLQPRWRPQRGCLVLAIGPATARALAYRGVPAEAPAGRYDSEGALALLALQRPRTVAVVGAPGGRGLLVESLRRRATKVEQVEVYRRVAPRLDGRHLGPLAVAQGRLLLLLSSVESLGHLHAQLPPAAWARLCQARVIASSERVAAAARAAGLCIAAKAASALGRDLLLAAAQVNRETGHAIAKAPRRRRQG